MPPLVGVEPMSRFEWERILKRVRMPKPLKFLALVLATYADADGTRVRPGEEALAADTGDTDRNVRRLIGVLRDQYGLIEQVARGGGRGGARRTTTYRLTIPVDLLDRCDVRTPEGRPIGSGRHLDALSVPESPDTQMSGQSGDRPVDNPESPDTQMSGQCGPSPVDNLPVPDIPRQIDRTSDVVTDALTGHFGAIDRTQLCPPTKDQPPKRPTTALEPAQPPDPRDPGEHELPDLIPSQSDGKCGHGLSSALDKHGAPRCPLCRRAARHLASVPALTA